MSTLRNILIFVLVFAAAISLLYFFLSREQNIFDFFSLEEANAGVEFPIDTNLKAANFVRSYPEFREEMNIAYRQLAEDGIGPEWKVAVVKIKGDDKATDSWSGRIYSERTLPKFVCELAFSPSGEILSKKECQWDK